MLNRAFDENDKKTAIYTPKAKKSLLSGPRTPTPFKNALDEFRKIRGETYIPSSPNGLVEDITEIMNNEKQQDNTVDSVYETDCSTATQAQNDQTMVSNPKRLSFDDVDHGQNSKKAKKSLDAAWNAEATPMSESKDLPYIVETPVSIIFPKKTAHPRHLFHMPSLMLMIPLSNHIFTEQSIEFEFRSRILTTQHSQRHPWRFRTSNG